MLLMSYAKGHRPEHPMHQPIRKCQIVKECVMFPVMLSVTLFLVQIAPFARSLIGIGLMCSGSSSHCGG